jgi:folate-dependent tRNA-U54 methylase TrmFO/GidA
MTYGEQARVLRMIPGLESGEFMRFGSVHRNTFVNAPEVLDETSLELRPRRGSSSRGRSPASRATSRAPRAGCSAR